MFNNSLIAGSSGQGGGDFYSHPIEQSLRFNDDDSPELTRTPSSAGNLKTWTYSAWIKPSRSGSQTGVLLDNTNSSNENGAWINIDKTSGKLFYGDFGTASYGGQLELSRNMRDPSAWYHIVFVHDTTNATASDRLRWYVNGERATDISQSVYPSQNYDGRWNTTNKATIGRFTDFTGYHYDGYMAEVHFIDGTALDASSFGETKSGVWIPKAYSGSYGTNGFYLDFDGTYYNDKSGNGNNWTANNLAATDVVLDSPTNNFATLNPLHGAHGCTLSEGNLYVTNPDNKSIGSGLAVTSGKWMAEVVCDSASYVSVGVCRDDETFGTNLNGSSEAWMYSYVGTVYKKGTSDTTPTTFTTGDIITLYLDLDNQKLYIYKNNSGITTSEGTHSVGSTGLSLDSGYGYYFCTTANGNNALSIWNFGQDSSFAGDKTAQGNTDDNGYGDFYYAPPTGYLALCTANLEVPDAMNPALDASPQDYFAPVAYTGDGTSSRNISVGFQSDLTWIKCRSLGSTDHLLFDVQRGAGYYLRPHITSIQYNTTGMLDAFNADGFQVGSNNDVNASGRTFGSWNWKTSNTTGSSNTDGSVTTTVSANQDAGISIMTYTTPASGTFTIGHGLSQAPEMVIIKALNQTYGWGTYHVGLGPTKYLVMNDVVGGQTGTIWNNTAPTSTVIHGNSSNFGTSTNFVTYAFHSVEGFSKFGSYTSNDSSTDNAFVYLGFRPAFVMVKNTSSSDVNATWTMHDSAREPYNVADGHLEADDSTAEGAGNACDFLSNGFKIRSNSYGMGGGSGHLYIYMAFAENPFKYANAR